MDTGVFYECTNLSAITLPAGLAKLGSQAFTGCYQLTGLNLPDHLTSIGFEAFDGCAGLGSMTIPRSVSYCGPQAFANCGGLTNVIIGSTNTSGDSGMFSACTHLASLTYAASVTNVACVAFVNSPSIPGLYFQGNAPAFLGNVHADNSGFTVPPGTTTVVYYLAGTTGWGATFGGLPTALWNPPLQTGSGAFGILTNQFRFAFTGVSNQTVIVQACTNLANPVWVPVATNTLTGGTNQFTDPQWTNYPVRYYRTVYPTMP